MLHGGLCGRFLNKAVMLVTGAFLWKRSNQIQTDHSLFTGLPAAAGCFATGS